MLQGRSPDASGRLPFIPRSRPASWVCWSRVPGLLTRLGGVHFLKGYEVGEVLRWVCVG